MSRSAIFVKGFGDTDARSTQRGLAVQACILVFVYCNAILSTK